VATLDARKDYDASAHTDDDLRSRAVTLRAFTNVAWAVTAAAGITGLVFLLGRSAPKETKTSNTAVSLGAGWASASVRF
jgi:hypothetical protein